jgi:hypothetical protein
LTVGSVAAGAFTLPAQAAVGRGTIEICKSSNNGMLGKSFSFTWVDSVAATGAVSVLGGGCSAPESVAGGNVTVTETQGGTTAVKAIRVSPISRLVSDNLASGTVVAKAPAGGTETVITYANYVPKAQLKVCKQAAADSTQLIGQPFSFTINGGTTFTVNAGPFGSPNCSALTTYASGTNVAVAELQPAAHVSVNSITVTPPATNISTNLSARTVSLTVNSGVQVVTYTNQIDVSAQKGSIEICKSDSDIWVSGNSFSFTIMDAAGASYGPFSVLDGQCTSAITMAQGPATITEAAQAPFYLGLVYDSNGYLISQNDSNGTASVDVGAQTDTVWFVNDTQLGYVKVCKALSANSLLPGALVGTTFVFDWTVAPSTGQASFSGTTSVVASATGPACKFIYSGIGLPLGSIVTFSEESTPNVVVSSASQTVTVTAGTSEVIFTNTAEGTIEICKDAADSETLGNGHNAFKFVVNGSINVTVNAGQCSRPIAVPAGTATVDELATLNFHEVSVTATGPTNDNRILFGTGVAPDLNPITVSVPFSGTSINGNETLVTYTNAVNTGVFKICKQSSSSTLLDESFVFNWSYTLNNTPTVGQVTLSPGECGYLNGSLSGTSPAIPVVGNSGAPVTVSVSGDTDTTGGIWVLNGLYYISSISFTGPGLLTSSDTYTGASSFTIGQGTNVLTYDNEACDSNGCPGAPTGRAS